MKSTPKPSSGPRGSNVSPIKKKVVVMPTVTPILSTSLTTTLSLGLGLDEDPFGKMALSLDSTSIRNEKTSNLLSDFVDIIKSSSVESTVDNAEIADSNHQKTSHNNPRLSAHYSSGATILPDLVYGFPQNKVNTVKGTNLKSPRSRNNVTRQSTALLKHSSKYSRQSKKATWQMVSSSLWDKSDDADEMITREELLQQELIRRAEEGQLAGESVSTTDKFNSIEHFEPAGPPLRRNISGQESREESSDDILTDIVTEEVIRKAHSPPKSRTAAFLERISGGAGPLGLQRSSQSSAAADDDSDSDLGENDDDRSAAPSLGSESTKSRGYHREYSSRRILTTPPKKRSKNAKLWIAPLEPSIYKEVMDEFFKYVTNYTKRKVVMAWNLIEVRYQKATTFKEKEERNEYGIMVTHKHQALPLSVLIGFLCSKNVKMMHDDLGDLFQNFDIPDKEIQHARRTAALRAVVTSNEGLSPKKLSPLQRDLSSMTLGEERLISLHELMEDVFPSDPKDRAMLLQKIQQDRKQQIAAMMEQRTKVREAEAKAQARRTAAITSFEESLAELQFLRGPFSKRKSQALKEVVEFCEQVIADSKKEKSMVVPEDAVHYLGLSAFPGAAQKAYHDEAAERKQLAIQKAEKREKHLRERLERREEEEREEAHERASMKVAKMASQESGAGDSHISIDESRERKAYEDTETSAEVVISEVTSALLHPEQNTEVRPGPSDGKQKSAQRSKRNLEERLNSLQPYHRILLQGRNGGPTVIELMREAVSHCKGLNGHSYRDVVEMMQAYSIIRIQSVFRGYRKGKRYSVARRKWNRIFKQIKMIHFGAWGSLTQYYVDIKRYNFRAIAAWRFYTKRAQRRREIFRICFWPYYVWRRWAVASATAKEKARFLTSRVMPTLHQMEVFRGWKTFIQRKLHLRRNADWYYSKKYMRKRVRRSLLFLRKWSKERGVIRRIWCSNGMNKLRKHHYIRMATNFQLWYAYAFYRKEVRARAHFYAPHFRMLLLPEQAPAYPCDGATKRKRLQFERELKEKEAVLLKEYAERRHARMKGIQKDMDGKGRPQSRNRRRDDSGLSSDSDENSATPRDGDSRAQSPRSARQSAALSSRGKLASPSNSPRASKPGTSRVGTASSRGEKVITPRTKMAMMQEEQERAKVEQQEEDEAIAKMLEDAENRVPAPSTHTKRFQFDFMPQRVFFDVDFDSESSQHIPEHIASMYRDLIDDFPRPDALAYGNWIDDFLTRKTNNLYLNFQRAERWALLETSMRYHWLARRALRNFRTNAVIRRGIREHLRARRRNMKRVVFDTFLNLMTHPGGRSSVINDSISTASNDSSSKNKDFSQAAELKDELQNLRWNKMLRRRELTALMRQTQRHEDDAEDLLDPKEKRKLEKRRARRWQGLADEAPTSPRTGRKQGQDEGKKAAATLFEDIDKANLLSPASEASFLQSPRGENDGFEDDVPASGRKSGRKSARRKRTLKRTSTMNSARSVASAISELSAPLDTSSPARSLSPPPSGRRSGRPTVRAQATTPSKLKARPSLASPSQRNSIASRASRSSMRPSMDHALHLAQSRQALTRHATADTMTTAMTAMTETTSVPGLGDGNNTVMTELSKLTSGAENILNWDREERDNELRLAKKMLGHGELMVAMTQQSVNSSEVISRSMNDLFNAKEAMIQEVLETEQLVTGAAVERELDYGSNFKVEAAKLLVDALVKVQQEVKITMVKAEMKKYFRALRLPMYNKRSKSLYNRQKLTNWIRICRRLNSIDTLAPQYHKQRKMWVIFNRWLKYVGAEILNTSPGFSVRLQRRRHLFLRYNSMLHRRGFIPVVYHNSKRLRDATSDTLAVFLRWVACVQESKIFRHLEELVVRKYKFTWMFRCFQAIKTGSKQSSQWVTEEVSKISMILRLDCDVSQITKRLLCHRKPSLFAKIRRYNRGFIDIMKKQARSTPSYKKFLIGYQREVNTRMETMQRLMVDAFEKRGMQEFVDVLAPVSLRGSQVPDIMLQLEGRRFCDPPCETFFSYADNPTRSVDVKVSQWRDGMGLPSGFRLSKLRLNYQEYIGVVGWQICWSGDGVTDIYGPKRGRWLAGGATNVEEVPIPRGDFIIGIDYAYEGTTIIGMKLKLFSGGWTRYYGQKATVTTQYVYLGVEHTERLPFEDQRQVKTPEEVSDPAFPEEFVVGITGLQTSSKATCLGLVVRKVKEQNMFSYIWVQDHLDEIRCDMTSYAAGSDLDLGLDTVGIPAAVMGFEGVSLSESVSMSIGSNARTSLPPLATEAGKQQPKRPTSPRSKPPQEKKKDMKDLTPIQGGGSASKRPLVKNKDGTLEEIPILCSENQFFDALRMRCMEIELARDRALSLAKRLWTDSRIRRDKKLSKLTGIRVVSKLIMWFFNAISHRLDKLATTESEGMRLLVEASNLKSSAQHHEYLGTLFLQEAIALEKTPQAWTGKPLLSPAERKQRKAFKQKIDELVVKSRESSEYSQILRDRSWATEQRGRSLLPRLGLSRHVVANYLTKIAAARQKESMLQILDMDTVKETLMGETQGKGIPDNTMASIKRDVVRSQARKVEVGFTLTQLVERDLEQKRRTDESQRSMKQKRRFQQSTKAHLLATSLSPRKGNSIDSGKPIMTDSTDNLLDTVTDNMHLFTYRKSTGFNAPQYFSKTRFAQLQSINPAGTSQKQRRKR